MDNQANLRAELEALEYRRRNAEVRLLNVAPQDMPACVSECDRIDQRIAEINDELDDYVDFALV